MTTTRAVRSAAAALTLVAALLAGGCGEDDGADVREIGGEECETGSTSGSGSESTSASGSGSEETAAASGSGSGSGSGSAASC